MRSMAQPMAALALAVAAVTGCSGGESTEAEPDGGPGGSTQSTTGDSSAVNGVYRFEVTDDELRAGGVTGEFDINLNHGLFTWTLEDGEYCWEQQAPNPLDNPDECSTYAIDGDQLTLSFEDGLSATFGWSLMSDDALELTPVGDMDPIALIWAAETWTKIADID